MTPPAISREDALAYLRVQAEIAKLEEQKTELRDRILPALVAGAKSPDDLPFRLVNRPQNRSTTTWKDVCFRVLKRFLGSKTKADAEMERIEKRFKKKPVPALCIEPNPGFMAQLVSSGAAQ